MQRLNRSAKGDLQANGKHHTRPFPAVCPPTPVIPGLLVSVCDLAEGRFAAMENVQIIDLKDPNRGSLGWADPQLWHEFAFEFPDSQLSAALGELDEAASLASRVPASFRFAKAGPSGANNVSQLVEAWQRLRRLLPPSVELVAVAYADHDAAETLPGELIFQTAMEMNIKTWLLDTYAKRGQSSLDHGGEERIQKMTTLASKASAQFALAGSITLPIAQQCFAAQAVPSWFAVRGDVCQNGRISRLDPMKLRRWTDWLNQLEV